MPWQGARVACLASGPSLTAEDVATVRAAGLPTIVTNTTFRMAPWADALFGFDVQWWRVHVEEVRHTFAGRMFCQSARWPMRGVEHPGIIPRYRSFGNSGACAIALAIACGAREVILIGFDCQVSEGRTHHHGDHPATLRNCDTIAKWPLQFARAASWAQKCRATVLNATRETALTCFDRVSLYEALAQRAAA